jgi:hypothetical protein
MLILVLRLQRRAFAQAHAPFWREACICLNSHDVAKGSQPPTASAQGAATYTNLHTQDGIFCIFLHLAAN